MESGTPGGKWKMEIGKGEMKCPMCGERMSIGYDWDDKQGAFRYRYCLKCGCKRPMEVTTNEKNI